MDVQPDEWGWWQDAAGKWHPPGPDSMPRPVHEPAPSHLFHHAEVIHPKHQRAGAGDYTVQPVVPPPKGLTTLLTVLGVVFASIILIGGLALLAYRIFDNTDDELTSGPVTATTLTQAECDAGKLALQEALLRYKAAHNADAPDVDALIPELLPSRPDGWDYRLDGANVILTPVDGCA